MNSTVFPQRHYGIVAALRDFFAAYDAQAMQKAHADVLALDFMQAPQELSTHIDWLEAEYDFNALFVGPDHPIAPPFASLYIERDGVLMGKHAVQMRELMHELHLSIPHEGSIPEDFLPYELDVLLVLYTLLEEHKDNTALYTGLDQARQWLESHLYAWLPLFIEKARSQGPRTAPLEHVFHILEAWIVSLNSQNSNVNEENL